MAIQMIATGDDPADALPIGGIILQAENIGKSVHTQAGELVILRTLSLEIKAADTLAITGASGSGKSTLLGLLAGLDLPTVGRCCCAGWIWELSVRPGGRRRAGATLPLCSSRFNCYRS